MIDKEINLILKPILEAISINLVKLNIKANQITFIGLILGIICFIFLIQGYFLLALLFFLLNRLFDGLDGYVARRTKITDLGGYYDIICDFVIYSLVPLGFIFYDENNSYAFSFLLASFIGTSSSFLAAAWIIEKNKSLLNLRSNKSFFYSRGIAEGFETILFFAIMFIFPKYAFLFAWLFGFICWMTLIIRVIHIKLIFSKNDN